MATALSLPLRWGFDSVGRAIGGPVMFGRIVNSSWITIVILVLTWVSPGSSLARTATIQNIPPTPHHAPSGTELVDLAEGIKRAARQKGWLILGESPESMTARLVIRSHTAIVVIGYDESSYQIDYLDSVNLGYSPNDLRRHRQKTVVGPRIHGNYNVWVKALARQIAIDLRNPPKATAAQKEATSTPVMIADELEKLDALRQRGVLTQQEFDAQKAKLLR